MVEVEPGVWLQSSHVSLVKDIVGPQVQVTLSSGYTHYVNDTTAKDLLRKLGIVTKWDHPPGQRPPER